MPRHSTRTHRTRRVDRARHRPNQGQQHLPTATAAATDGTSARRGRGAPRGAAAPADIPGRRPPTGVPRSAYPGRRTQVGVPGGIPGGIHRSVETGSHRAFAAGNAAAGAGCAHDHDRSDLRPARGGRAPGRRPRRPGAGAAQALRPDPGGVDGVDLEVRRGECFALLGPNGAGKTTATEILEGYRQRDGGEVEVLGADPRRADATWRSRIGIVLQIGERPDRPDGERVGRPLRRATTPIRGR